MPPLPSPPDLRGRCVTGPPQQTGLLVRDIHAAVRRYARVLGIGSWVGYTYGPETVPELRYRGQPGRYSMMIALSAVEPQVELIQPLGGPSIYHEWMEEHGEGLHHVAYVVPSLEDGVSEMATLGYTVIQSGAGFGLDGDGAFAYFDTADDLAAIVELRVLPRRRREPDWTLGPTA